MSPILGVIASAKLKADVYFGYSLGGQTTGGSVLSSVLQWGFKSETASTLTDTLTLATAGSAAGVTYKGNRAYKIGGNGTVSAQQYVSKWAYATGTKTDVSTTMTARGYAAGISNPNTAGYAWGGEGGSPLVYYSNTQKILFSNDSLSTISTGGVGSNTNQGAGANNGTSTGYRIGGDTADVGKINFSNDTLSVGNSFVMEYVTSITNGTTSTYLMGGQNRNTGVRSNQIARFTFSGESFSVIGATLSSARTINCAFSDFATYGWVLGGNETAPVTVIQRFTYSGETISTLGTSLATARANAANANNYA